MYDIAIIGAGASGLMAAITALRARPSARVVLLEKGPRSGKKLLATGNGRCNISNTDADNKARYHSTHPDIMQAVLGGWSAADTRLFFAELGVPLVEREHGRLYPYSLQASAVLDALRYTAEALGAELRVEAPVTDLRAVHDGFMLDGLRARRVIVAAGGEASPSTGSDGSGLRLLTALGHTAAPCRPSLTQLLCGKEAIRGLSGLRVQAKAVCRHRGQLLSHREGELLFTDYGVSGPLALDISAELADLWPDGFADTTLEINFFPQETAESLAVLLEAGESRPFLRPAEDYFLGLLHKRVGMALLRAADIAPSQPDFRPDAPQRTALLTLAMAYPIPVTGLRGFADAQTTRGGALLCEFIPKTLESRIVPGLHACGEVLDVDGDCGGFNLQWAWASGWAAGHAE